jgi:predicted RNA binding protein YcfA (HicA-like mRNA interferase family)
MPATRQGGYWYANAIRASGLPPPARHIAHVLASVADSESGRARVSLTWLQTDTGLSRSSVAKYLNVLEQGGWILRNRAGSWAATKQHEVTEYVTVIPDGYPAKGSPSHGLPSAAHGLGVVRESDKASPPHGPSTTSTNAGTRGNRGRAKLPPLPLDPHAHTDDCCNLPAHHRVHSEAS